MVNAWLANPRALRDSNELGLGDHHPRACRLLPRGGGPSGPRLRVVPLRSSTHGPDPEPRSETRTPQATTRPRIRGRSVEPMEWSALLRGDGSHRDRGGRSQHRAQLTIVVVMPRSPSPCTERQRRRSVPVRQNCRTGVGNPAFCWDEVRRRRVCERFRPGLGMHRRSRYVGLVGNHLRDHCHPPAIGLQIDPDVWRPAKALAPSRSWKWTTTRCDARAHSLVARRWARTLSHSD